MLHCPYCHVNVAGNKTCCPLCQGELTGSADLESEVFPPLARSRISNYFLLRLLAFICIAVSGVCVLVNVALHSKVWWSLFVVAGAFCVWLAAAIGIVNRRNTMQNVTRQAFLVPILSLFWDICTGWRGWSIDYVLPCVCMAALLTMLILIIAMRMPARSFAGYFTLVCLFGLVPAVLVACGIVHMLVPSLICIGLSLFSLAALILFQWQVFYQELVRRFHL